MPATIGQRRVRGTIHGPTVVQDDSGYEVETFAAIATQPIEWVQIAPLRAAEIIQAQQVFGTTSAMLHMRFRDDVTERMQFHADNGDVWDFLAPPVDPTGKRAELEILVGRSD